jgi:hypothetical protein
VKKATLQRMALLIGRRAAVVEDQCSRLTTERDRDPPILR